MKTIIKLFVLLATSILAASCGKQDSTMRTLIKPDGSCTRTVEIEFDTAQLTNGRPDYDKMAFRFDRNWTLNWAEKGSKDRHPFPVRHARTDGIVIIASSEWDHVEDMARHTLFVPDTLIITPKAEFRRSFKWFYTDYTFKETYPKVSLPFRIPLEKYLSTEEIGYWFRGEPDLAQGLSGMETDDLMDGIKEKYGKWLVANWMEGLCGIIEDNYSSIKNAPVDKREFAAKRQILIQKACGHSSAIIENMGREAVDGIFHEVFRSTAYDKIVNDDSKTAALERTFAAFNALVHTTVCYQILMPGSNGEEGMADGGAFFQYRLTGSRLLAGEYIINPSVRVRNLWAFLLTGFIMLLSLFLVWRKWRHSR